MQTHRFKQDQDQDCHTHLTRECNQPLVSMCRQLISISITHSKGWSDDKCVKTEIKLLYFDATNKQEEVRKEYKCELQWRIDINISTFDGKWVRPKIGRTDS